MLIGCNLRNILSVIVGYLVAAEFVHCVEKMILLCQQ
jgi:hypothetical protein